MHHRDINIIFGEPQPENISDICSYTPEGAMWDHFEIASLILGLSLVLSRRLNLSASSILRG
jgi:hypothetical protein